MKFNNNWVIVCFFSLFASPTNPTFILKMKIMSFLMFGWARSQGNVGGLGISVINFYLKTLV